ncbi:MAG: hypothetical protein HEQ38_17030 [Gemmatimonas sp.]|nr:hypothetical protein [Gemmatimonas sp.]
MRESTKDLAPRSRCLEALDFRDGAVFEPTSGLVVARSGHRFSWSRGTSTLAGVNAVGGTYTAPATLPAYESANNQLGVNLGGDDVLRGNAAVGWLPQELSGELLFVERGARIGTAGGTLWAIAGDDPATGVRIFIDTTGTGSGFYRITYHNGSTSVTATLASGQPTAGQLVRLRWLWSASGLTLRQSINGGVFTTATSGALALPSAYATGARTRIGRRGATQNPAPLTLLSYLLIPGTLTDAQFDEAY